MGGHVVVDVDRLVKPDIVESAESNRKSGTNPSTQNLHVPYDTDKDMEDQTVAGEEEPLIQTLECRICQEEDQLKNLETPCACSGSLKV